MNKEIQEPGYFLPADTAHELDRILRRHVKQAAELGRELDGEMQKLTPAQKALALDYIQSHPAIHGGSPSGGLS